MTGRKNVLYPYHMISAGDMSQATVTSAVTDISGLDNFRMYLTFSGTPTGTFAVQTSPDSGVSWLALTLTPAPVASGSADTIYIDLNNLPDEKIRVVYTKTSGTGTLDGWILGKAV